MIVKNRAAIKNLKLWGKILTQGKDYYIVECESSGEGEEAKDD